MTRKWTAWLLAAACLIILRGARAETEFTNRMSDPYSSGNWSVSWQELNVPRGTVLPVYSAPWEDAWRGAGGEAAVDTGEHFTLLGTVDGGAWGLVDCRGSDRSRRLGWIRIPEGSALPMDWDLRLSLIPLRVRRNVPLTDDPEGESREIRTLKAGESVTGLMFLEETEQVYVETRNEGKVAFGLIPADSCEDVTESFLIPEGDTLRIREGITVIGDVYRFIDDPTPEDESHVRTVTRVRPGEVGLDSLDLQEWNARGIRQILLPESLRYIGSESLAFGTLDELCLKAGLEVDAYAMYAADIGRIVISRDYTAAIPEGSYSKIGEFDVEAGNPLYSDIGGVLFTADGKTLLRYPTGRQDEHYDVPAGTKEIGPRAFSDGSTTLPLRSVSLPVGLQKIDRYAFADCVNLLSLTVPLTVTEVAPDAFANCVSLERLSLPPGITASLGGWVIAEDYSGSFHGDNWSTYRAPVKRDDEWDEESDCFLSYEALLDNPEGSGAVPVYPSPEAAVPSGTKPVGTRIYVNDVRNGRADIEGWVDLQNVLNQPGAVFFRVTGGRLKDSSRQFAPDGRPLLFSGIWDGKADFYPIGGAYEEVSFPLRDTVLYRERTGDGARMGLVAPLEDSAALTDTAAGGKKLLHLYAETQARILEEAGDRIRIETAYGTGWISRDELVEVYEKPERMP